MLPTPYTIHDVLLTGPGLRPQGIKRYVQDEGVGTERGER